MRNGNGGAARVSRRRLLGWTVPVAAVGLVAPPVLASAPKRVRSLSLRNLHTDERVAVDYWIDGWYSPDALAEINHLMRDFRTGEVHPMDRELLDLLHRVHNAMESDADFEVFSAYRSPRTNAMLARRNSRVAKQSLHMRGMAADVRLPGRRLGHLRRAAKSLRLGGVGYYPKSGFVHLDVGRPRFW